MAYRVVFSRPAEKAFRKLPRPIQERLAPAIKALAENPRPDGCKKLKGQHNATYRIRVGDYRVVYEVQDSVLVVLVLDVGDRKDVYRG